MFRHVWKFTFFTLVFTGCVLFDNPKPGGNYVPITGLVCTSPEMVDGDLKTSDTVYVEGSMGVGEHSLMSPNSKAARWVAPTTVKLPTQQKVGMIVLYGENLTNFKVLAKDGKEWKELRRLRFRNPRKRVAITTPVVTNAIRIIAITDELIPKGRRPEIQEIQVYGAQ